MIAGPGKLTPKLNYNLTPQAYERRYPSFNNISTTTDPIRKKEGCTSKANSNYLITSALS
jgi:hypothetical protein